VETDDRAGEIEMDRRTGKWRLLGSGRLFLATPGSDAERSHLPDREVIDGLDLDYRREPRCLVCAADSEIRVLVDQLLVRGESYTRIIQAVESEETDSSARPISYASVRRHQQRHLPVDELGVRTIIEARARERGLQIALADSPIVTNAAVLEIVRNAGFEAILAGGLVPTVRETITAAVALQQLDDEADSGAIVEAIHEQLQILLEIVRERLPEESWNSVVAEFEQRLNGSSTGTGSGRGTDGERDGDSQ
jgi:hypothetical protein